MYKIYVIKFGDGKRYIGMTTNFHQRIAEHRRGKNRSTKNKAIVDTKIIEECSNGIEARKREKYWKSGQGRERLKI